MTPGLLVRLRPAGPWRFGSRNGDRRETDTIYHSDSLYSAVCAAMGTLGGLGPWLEATAQSDSPAVRFTSAYPWQGETLFLPAPRSVTSAAGGRIRRKGVRFVPVSAVDEMIAGAALGEQWEIDPASGCLLPTTGKGRPRGPFRVAERSGSAVDRVVEGRVLPHTTAAIEFAPDAGLWFFAAFSDEAALERWRTPLTAAVRLLADSGFGGRRSIGWGRSEQPEITTTTLEELVPIGRETPAAAWAPSANAEATAAEEAPTETAPAPAGEREPEDIAKAAEQAPEDPPEVTSAAVAAEENAVAAAVPPGRTPYWLLSLFCPGTGETVDWGAGNYELLTRGGRIQSSAASGTPKKLLQAVAEGSVLLAETPPCGRAVNVAPDGFAHPVYRYGLAVAVPLSGRGSR